MNKIVWLVSYPRSGNTWLRLLMANIQYPEEVRSYQFIDAKRKIPDIHQHYSIAELKQRNFDRSPIFVKSHYKFLSEYFEFPSIYLYRDVRDVSISYYHFHYTKYERLSFDNYLDFVFIPGREIFGGWDSHVNLWLNESPSFNFFAIRYEDFFYNTKDILIDAFRFLNLNYDGDVIDEAIRRTQFENLKKLAQKDGVHKKLLGLRGKPRGWKEILTSRQINVLNEKYGSLLKCLGYEV